MRNKALKLISINYKYLVPIPVKYPHKNSKKNYEMSTLFPFVGILLHVNIVKVKAVIGIN